MCSVSERACPPLMTSKSQMQRVATLWQASNEAIQMQACGSHFHFQVG